MRQVQPLLRLLLLISVVLLIPAVPFLVFGGPLEQQMEACIRQPHSRPVAAAIVVGLLSTDVFLPVPSSVVSTLAGTQLGPLGGTAASWLGMSIGAIVGFAVARRWGRPLALRYSRAEVLDRMEPLGARFGPAILVLTRAVPVLAEASVLLMGLQRLSWWKFLTPVLLSNLGIALAYAALGHVAQKHQWLAAALAVSIALPLLATTVMWKYLPVAPSPPQPGSASDAEDI